jgi:hypothetical protein
MLKAGSSPAFFVCSPMAPPQRRPVAGYGYFLVKFPRAAAAENFSFHGVRPLKLWLLWER